MSGDVYSCVLVDPREILEGTQLIINDYVGSTNGVYNLINCYGYMENYLYGYSGATPAGMPWAKIQEALLGICNSGSYNAFGGPLNYRGVLYSLDLSELPVPPPFYRMTGNSIGLLDAIQQLCNESAHSFFVELRGYTIRVRTINKNVQPVFGTISNAVNNATLSGGSPRGEFGVEARNDTTSAFVVGGSKCTLFTTGAISSFWGYDLAGNPILGVPFKHPNVTGTAEAMNLNATGIADIVGAVTYSSNTVEMRCALHSEDAWTTYIGKYKPTIYKYIHGIMGNVKFANVDAVNDVVNDDANVLQNIMSDQIVSNTTRFYNWIRTIAEEYYGRQYLVGIPFVLSKTDPETTKVTYSSEPTTSGYLEAGAPSLGISALNQDVISDADERILPFVNFKNIAGADTQRVNWSDTAIENNQMFCRVNMAQKIIFIPGAVLSTPAVHIQLSSVLYDKQVDPYGDINVAQALFFADKPGVMKKMDGVPEGGTIGVLGIHPAARAPQIVGVPLKSNVDTYGPWFIAGAPGKVHFEQDHSLTPWDYGNYVSMNNAGQARVLNAVTSVQQQESGSVELVGPPAYSLGDTLESGGPNLTNLEVSFGTNGVTTNYRFASTTPRFGVFSKQNADRLQRASLAMVEVRRNTRKALNRAVAALTTIAIAYRANKQNQSKHVTKESPHTVIFSRAFVSNGYTRTGVGTDTYQAGLALTRPADTGATTQNMAMMSWNGMFRPYTTQATGYSGILPKYGSGFLQGSLNRSHLEPFRSGHDIDIVTSRVKYSGVNAWQRGSDSGSTRALGLRGPVMVVGWGYGTDGTVYPSGANPQLNFSKWKAGPVDMLWDDARGVWTSHDLLAGWLPSGVSLAAGGTTNFYVGGNSGWQLPVSNWFSSPIGSGSKIIAGYCVNANKWYVIAADCTS